MGKAEIWIFFTSLQLDICQVSAVIFHILQATWRRKIVKMVKLGKEIENKKKWNEEKLGPCMNVFINFDPYTRNIELILEKNKVSVKAGKMI